MPANRAARPRPAKTDSPRPNGLNLDTLKREGVPNEPYTCVLDGRLYTFSDPLEMDWQDATKMDPQDVIALVKSLLNDADWKQFSQHRVPLWKIADLARDIQEHYRITVEDEGKGDGSNGS